MQSHEPVTDEELYETEVLEGELVEYSHAAPAALNAEQVPISISPLAVQTAVAAATGFVAGAATLALLRRYGIARLERGAAAHGVALPPARGARTYIVHVRPLRPDSE